jgi:hypothetical protein
MIISGAQSKRGTWVLKCKNIVGRKKFNTVLLGTRAATTWETDFAVFGHCFRINISIAQFPKICVEIIR